MTEAEETRWMMARIYCLWWKAKVIPGIRTSWPGPLHHDHFLTLDSNQDGFGCFGDKFGGFPV